MLDFALNENSTVFVIGAYGGGDSQPYVNSHMYLFEPQTNFANGLKKKYKDNSKVKVFDFGLGERDFIGEMSQYGLDGASFIPMPGVDLSNSKYGFGRVREIGQVMSENHVTDIELCIMNCEGYEWILLPWMVQNHIIEKVKFLMVQFHVRYEGSDQMDKIIDMLNTTHEEIDRHDPSWIVWALRTENG